MRLINTLRSATILAALMVTSSVARGQTYEWPATGGAGLATVSYNYDGQAIYTPVPAPTSVSLSLSYTYGTDPLSQTYGDETTFFGPQFSLDIEGVGSPNWPGFAPWAMLEIMVTVPTDGQGLDLVTFWGVQPGRAAGIGGVTIGAPLGTLSTSTELPPNLDAFEQYGQTNDAGYWSYSGGYGYAGTAHGLLGPTAAPEPGSIWLLSIGATGCWVLRRFAASRRRTDPEAC